MTKKQTKIHIHKIRFIITAAIGVGISSFIFLRNNNNSAFAYPVNCNSEACRAAYDRAMEASANAAEASRQATTLEEAVGRLSEEIAAIQAEIIINQTLMDEVNERIENTQEKLTSQQAALARMLVNMHFDSDNDSIKILAGSKSLGDLAERQARQATAKNQISNSAIKVRELKQNLEGQKDELAALIHNSETRRAEAEQKRQEQADLMEKYRDNADAYAADAESAMAEMRANSDAAAYNSNGVVAEGLNSYPRQANCPQDNVGYIYMAGYVCQCTSYAGWKAYEGWGITIGAWGNAKDWVNGYSGHSKTAYDVWGAPHSFRIDQTPAAKTVGITTGGPYGHVFWIESINSDGTLNISEYNNSYSSLSRLPGDFGYRIGASPADMYFIHFDQPIY